MRAEKSRITGSFIGLPTNSTTPLRRGGFPGGSDGKGPACNAKDLSSVPGLGRSPGEGKGYPLQYSGLENSMNGIVHGVTKSRTRQNDFRLALSERATVTTQISLHICKYSTVPNVELLNQKIHVFVIEAAKLHSTPQGSHQGSHQQGVRKPIPAQLCQQSTIRVWGFAHFLG